ncbi:hypothetical protein [Agrococcus sp. Ld7]|uniref:hypothetical protein n=1 Tax=Agrococcus sp. Ld7 TaxID=649148 RepID=UPI003866477D
MQHRPSPTAAKLAVAALAIAMLAGCASAAPAQEAPEETTTNEVSVSTAPEAPAEPETIEPLALNADGLLGGNATVTDFDAGEPGEVSMVSVGTLNPDSGTLPFVFRNNTAEAVSHVDATATIRDSAGALVANGSSQGTTPGQILPGGLGLAYLYIEEGEVPEGAEIEINFATSPADQSPFNTANLRVAEWSETEDGFIGTAANETGVALSGPFSVQVYCFDETGALTTTTGGYANEQEVDADGSASFSHSFYGDACSSYYVGVTGWFN